MQKRDAGKKKRLSTYSFQPYLDELGINAPKVTASVVFTLDAFNVEKFKSPFNVFIVKRPFFSGGDEGARE